MRFAFLGPLAGLITLALSSVAASPLAAPFMQDPVETPGDPPTGTIDLYVVDEDNEPVFKASVWVEFTDEERRQKALENGGFGFTIDSAQTDPDGYVELEVPVGMARQVRVSPRGVEKSELLDIEALKEGESREMEVTLKSRPDRDAVIFAVDAESGAPLEGVEVYRVGSDSFGERAILLPMDRNPDALTDENGRASWRVRSWRSAGAILQAKGRSTKALTVVGGKGFVRSAEQPVAMDRCASLAGSLEFPSERGADKVLVELKTPGYQMTKGDRQGGTDMFLMDEVSFVTPVLEGGRFEFPSLPADVPFTLGVRQGRKSLLQETATRIFRAGESAELALALGQGADIVGQVVEADGSPAAGLKLWLASPRGTVGTLFQSYEKPHASAETDAEGRFVFPAVDPGRWRVGLAPLGYRTKLPESERYPATLQFLEVSSGGTAPEPLAFTLHRGLYVSGEIQVPEGYDEVTSGLGASLSGATYLFGQVKPDGTFHLGPLAPGKYTLTGRAFGRPGHPSRMLAAAKSSEFEVAPGKDLEPVIVQLGVGASLSVTGVNRVTGEPVATSMTLVCGPKDPRSISIAPKDVHDFMNREPGPHTVILTTADQRVGIAHYDLEAGDDLAGEEITLERGGAVSIRYKGPIPYGQVELIQNDQVIGFNTLESGTSQAFVGPAGTATVRVYSSTRTDPEKAFDERRQVELEPGKTILVEVQVGGE